MEIKNLKSIFVLYVHNDTPKLILLILLKRYPKCFIRISFNLYGNGRSFRTVDYHGFNIFITKLKYL